MLTGRANPTANAMNTTAVLCNQCGATLEVDEATRFVTCRYCGTNLAVRQSDSTLYTEVLDEIREKTREVADGMQDVRLQNELERIDREWMMERERYAIHGQNGSSYPESGGHFGAVMGAVVGIVFIIIMCVEMNSSRAGMPPFFPVIVMVFIGLFIYRAVSSGFKVNDYEVAKEAYEARRQDVLRRIAEREDGA